MILPSLLVVLVASLHMFGQVRAHYVFSRFMFNETITEQWQYVRNLSLGQARDSGLWDQYMPLYNLSSPDLRCGRGASTSGLKTQTATILAGSTVGFIIGRSADEPLEPYIIYHPGPGQAYLSRSPDHIALDNYTGDGYWFKIGYLGPRDDSTWTTRGERGMNFTIPERTPQGRYLLRVEHLYVQPGVEDTQFYVACAQVEVLGAGVGMPGPMVRFPGAYGAEDEGILVPQEMYEWPNRNLLSYKAPGPLVWEG